jgi:hypothetical protein
LPCGYRHDIIDAFFRHSYSAFYFRLFISRRRTMRLKAFLFLLGLVSLPLPALGQTVDLARDRVPMTELAGPWRFHAGDSIAWSNPGFDDHDWSLLSTDLGWSEQGYKGYGGMAWYRLRVLVPAQHQSLGFYLPSVDESCEIFANGKLIGRIGSLPPDPKLVSAPRASFAIPDSTIIPGQPLLLAVRVWHWPAIAGSPGGGMYPAPRIGEASAISEWKSLQDREAIWGSTYYMMDFLANLLAALASLGLFALRPKEREYLWFGLNQAAWAGYQVAQLHYAFLKTPYIPWAIAATCLFALGLYTGLEFIRSLAGQRSKWLYWATILFVLAYMFGRFYLLFRPEAGSFEVEFLIGYTFGLVAMLFLGARAGNQDALLVMIPNVIQMLNEILYIVADNYHFAAWSQAIRRWEFGGIEWPFPVMIPSLIGDITTIAILIVLIRRFARSRRDEERLESEVEAARIVQQVLVPAEIPAIPGFRVESVYRPAGQVGGDFFQIIPISSGGALIAVGDVSGKGMPAAMTVSLLVGTFRTLAHYTQSPSEILAAMNQRMLARSKGGFTTCLLLKTEKDGTLTFANAGHIAPFVNGEELKVENGLPLGVSAESIYPESTIQLPSDAQLTVVTDGVVEARSKTGELFGFARTQGISRQPAGEIARAAQSFGRKTTSLS